MYADDTVLFFSAIDVSDIQKVLSTELNLVHKWLQLNKLFLNIAKTEVVLSGTGARLTQLENFRVSIGRYQQQRVTEYKYLGVDLDATLSWKSHVTFITSKVRKGLGLLCRVRDDLTANAANLIYKAFIYLTANAANLIYKAFILLILDYCDSVWACCNRGHINRLERLQNRAGRIVMKSTRRAPALANLNWDSLEVR